MPIAIFAHKDKNRLLAVHGNGQVKRAEWDGTPETAVSFWAGVLESVAPSVFQAVQPYWDTPVISDEEINRLTWSVPLMFDSWGRKWLDDSAYRLRLLLAATYVANGCIRRLQDDELEKNQADYACDIYDIPRKKNPHKMLLALRARGYDVADIYELALKIWLAMDEKPKPLYPVPIRGRRGEDGRITFIENVTRKRVPWTGEIVDVVLYPDLVVYEKECWRTQGFHCNEIRLWRVPHDRSRPAVYSLILSDGELIKLTLAKITAPGKTWSRKVAPLRSLANELSEYMYLLHAPNLFNVFPDYHIYWN